MRSRNAAIPALMLLCLSACEPSTGPDDAGGREAGGDGGPDAGESASVDAGDPSADAGDPSPDAGDPPVDAGGDAGPLPAGYGIYDEDGSEPVTTTTLDVVTDTDHSFELLTFVPGSPGPHPVVTLSPGTQQPAEAYTSYGERLASHGFVVVIRDDPGVFTSTPTVVEDLAYVVTTYLPAHHEDSGSPLFGKLDLERVGLAGHSRGGKASLLAAEHELHGLVLGWFGLDPVDSSTFADGEFALYDLPTVGIPTAFLFAEIESNCSPASTTAAALWPPAPAPTVMITGLGAGHMQLEDREACIGCQGLCTPGGTAPDVVVLRYAVRYLTAFFARELLGDDTVGPAFSGAGAARDVSDGLIAIEIK